VFVVKDLEVIYREISDVMISQLACCEMSCFTLFLLLIVENN